MNFQTMKRREKHWIYFYQKKRKRFLLSFSANASHRSRKAYSANESDFRRCRRRRKTEIYKPLSISLYLFSLSQQQQQQQLSGNRERAIETAVFRLCTNARNGSVNVSSKQLCQATYIPLSFRSEKLST